MRSTGRLNLNSIEPPFNSGRVLRPVQPVKKAILGFVVRNRSNLKGILCDYLLENNSWKLNYVLPFSGGSRHESCSFQSIWIPNLKRFFLFLLGRLFYQVVNFKLNVTLLRLLNEGFVKGARNTSVRLDVTFRHSEYHFVCCNHGRIPKHWKVEVVNLRVHQPVTSQLTNYFMQRDLVFKPFSAGKTKQPDL